MAYQVDDQGAAGLYDYDAVARLRDSQLGDERVHDISNYILRGKIWEAFESDDQPVLLIDEIDKADIEFPNDLLQELDRMEFYVYETKTTRQSEPSPDHRYYQQQRKGTARRVPAPLLFSLHQVSRQETMTSIVDVHFPGLKKTLLKEALDVFTTCATCRD